MCRDAGVFTDFFLFNFQRYTNSNMLQLSNNMIGIAIMSLRTGGKIATGVEPIINPHNLKIEAWYCDDMFSKDRLVLLAQDIRDFVPQGIAVNDHDVLTDPDDLIRLQDILKLDFRLIGKSVVTNHKRRVGKVTDYAVDTGTLVIQKLYVSRPMYKSINDSHISIDHSQIIEINDKKIIIKEADVKVSQAARMPAFGTS